MEVYHEKFGTGTILNSTEQFDEAGNIVSADVMFEHGIEQDIQLDELSKKTLGSYIKKSADSAVDNARDSDDSGNRSYDRRYYDADQRKIHATDSKNYFNKSQKRLSGISKATSKLTKEEIEDLENDILDIVDEAVNSALNEKLSGSQHKIDANKNGKVDAHDFKLLRGKKTDTDESADDKDDMKEGKISKALTGAAIAATLSAGGMMAKGAHDYHQKDPRIAMSQYDLDKMGGKDFTKIKESVEVTPRMTPDSASMRMPAVESVVRDIMSQQSNLRQEAKIAEFKSRNK